jgi:hypothetical protein
MENVKKYSSFIKRIVTTLPTIRKKLLSTSNLDIIKAICDIVLNIYYKQIPISAGGLRALKKNKVILLQLISNINKNKNSLQAKKELLIKYSDCFIGIKEIFSNRKKN